jgi:hypothetical protein
MAAWKKRLRPYMSPSLPHNGVDAVEARRYAVTTQDRCEAPPRSPTIVGSAVETIVWSSAANSIPISSAPRISQSRRPVTCTGCVVALTWELYGPAEHFRQQRRPVFPQRLVAHEQPEVPARRHVNQDL